MDTETGTVITAGSPERISWPRRHKITTAISALGAVAALLATAILLTHQGQIAVRGDMEVLESCFSASTDYPDIATGSQVVITDASGKVLAVTALGGMKNISMPLSGGACDYPFAVTVPSGQSRYGVTIGHNRGTVWFTPAQMKDGPALELNPPSGF